MKISSCRKMILISVVLGELTAGAATLRYPDPRFLSNGTVGFVYRPSGSDFEKEIGSLITSTILTNDGPGRIERSIMTEGGLELSQVRWLAVAIDGVREKSTINYLAINAKVDESKILALLRRERRLKKYVSHGVMIYAICDASKPDRDPRSCGHIAILNGELLILADSQQTLVNVLAAYRDARPIPPPMELLGVREKFLLRIVAPDVKRVRKDTVENPAGEEIQEKLFPGITAAKKGVRELVISLSEVGQKRLRVGVRIGTSKPGDAEILKKQFEVQILALKQMLLHANAQMSANAQTSVPEGLRALMDGFTSQTIKAEKRSISCEFDLDSRALVDLVKMGVQQNVQSRDAKTVSVQVNVQENVQSSDAKTVMGPDKDTAQCNLDQLLLDLESETKSSKGE